MSTATPTRSSSSISGLPIALKGSAKNVAGTTVGDDFEEEVQSGLDGNSQIKILDSLIILIENEILDMNNEEVVERYNTLKKLIRKTKL